MALYSAAFSKAQKAISDLFNVISDDPNPPVDPHLFVMDANERSKVLSRTARLSEAKNQLFSVRMQLDIIEDVLQRRRHKILNELAYINILPTEIVRKIFSIAYNSSFSVHSQVTFSRNVSHVSQRWRHIALHQSEIWTSILLSLKKNVLNGAQAFITRSAGRPLHVQVHGRGRHRQRPYMQGIAQQQVIEQGVPEQMRSVINQTSSRWAYLCIDDNFHEFLHASPLQLPALITIDTTRAFRSQRQVLDSLFAPGLRRFVIRDLRILEGGEGDDEDDEDDEDDKEHSSIIRQASEILVVGVNAATGSRWIFDHCPKLESLELHDASSLSRDDIPFLKPSGNLTTLIVSPVTFKSVVHRGVWKGLRRLGIHRGSHIEHIDRNAFSIVLSTSFSTMNTLVDLSMEVDLDVAITVLEVLNSNNSDTGARASVFLPSLETVDILIYFYAGSIDKLGRLLRAISVFARQRGKTSPSRNHACNPLRHISLKVRNTSINIPEEILSSVEEFSCEYMRPEWWRTWDSPYPRH